LIRNGLSVESIGHIVVSHFHPDHAGLVQEVKDTGARLVLTEAQVPFIKPLERIVKPDSGFLPIVVDDNLVLKPEESRGFLKEIGFDGEILSTPGHSPDSVSLILDEGIAFTGDLTPEIQLTAEDTEAHDSWAAIRERGVHTVFPAHGAAPVSI
jgi:glyoxylase-like metal-dependent hydrolase (beta-lactamase superfamily II)